METCSTEAAAAKVGISYITLRRWLAAGDFEPSLIFEMGERTLYRFTTKDIERLQEYKSAAYCKGRGPVPFLEAVRVARARRRHRGRDWVERFFVSKRVIYHATTQRALREGLGKRILVTPHIKDARKLACAEAAKQRSAAVLLKAEIDINRAVFGPVRRPRNSFVLDARAAEWKEIPLS